MCFKYLRHSSLSSMETKVQNTFLGVHSRQPIKVYSRYGSKTPCILELYSRWKRFVSSAVQPCHVRVTMPWALGLIWMGVISVKAHVSAMIKISANSCIASHFSPSLEGLPQYTLVRHAPAMPVNACKALHLILTKIGMCQQMSLWIPSIKYQENPVCQSQVVTLGLAGGN